MFEVTTIHPVALGITLLMGIGVLLAPRRFSYIPFLLDGVLITEMQRFVLFGFDFTMLRLLLLLGLARIVVRGEYRGMARSPIDSAVLAYTVVDVCAYTLLWGSTSAVVNRLGFALNTLGIYFFIRCTVRDAGDIRAILHILAVITGFLALSMLIEQRTGRNFFSLFGGVSAMIEMREGRLRSQGAFPVPLLAGAFGATLLPLFFWESRFGRKGFGALGIAASVTIALTSFSSGPLLALIAGVIGLSSWIVRFQMRAIRWAAIMGLVGLSFVMKAPVYALVSRANLFDASGGYHRYVLIDQAVKRFGEWCFLGTKSTAHWGWGLWDVTNEYIAVGVEGGLTTLLIFISAIALAFRNVGRGIRMNGPKATQYLLWALGASLFAHSVAFIGMAYFGAQIFLNWYFVLAAIAIAPQIALTPVLVEPLFGKETNGRVRCDSREHMAIGAVRRQMR